MHDPDDFRELDGHLEPGDVIVVDEVTLAGLPVNDVKKLFDVEKNRRVRCRHFNGSIPKHCPRIFCTNGTKQQGTIKNHNDNAAMEIFPPIGISTSAKADFAYAREK